MSTQERPSAAGTVPSGATKRGSVLFAGIAGQSVEYYDFLIYGTAAALIFNKQFFPSLDPVAGVLASFATFAVGFAGRPAGAVLFGHLGDKFGRKPAWLAAMLLMALATLVIGLLPTYAVVGVAAPAILALVRFLQGVSVGGQWGGATLLSLEHGPPNRRGLFGALPQLGVVVGMVGGTLVFLLVSQMTTPAQFASWGWRIPFLLTVVMFPVAYFVHRYIEETPQFREVETKLAARSEAARGSAVVQVLRHPRQMLLVAFTFLSATIMFYGVVTGVLDYAVRDLHIPKNTMLTVVMISMVAFGASAVGFAWLSDLVGRRVVYAAGAALGGVWAFALFPLVQTRSFGLILLAAVVGQIAVGAMFGPGTALFAEAFPPRVRYSGASMGNQLANILGGGLAPFIMVALLEATHTTVAASIYMAAAAAVSLVAVAVLRIPRNPDAATTMQAASVVSRHAVVE